MAVKQHVSEIDFIASSAFAYTKSILVENIFSKLILGSLAFTFGTIYEKFSLVLGSVVVLYTLDFIFGVLRAIKNDEFDSKKFYSGAVKGIVYGLFMYICFSLDQALHTGVGFTSFILSFMVVRDSVSILENLENLGVNTPIGLTKYLKYKIKNMMTDLEEMKK